MFRKAAFGANFAVIGIENQKQVYYLMLIRCLEYDLKEYQRQESELKKAMEKAVKEGMKITEDEFLSGVFKEEKMHPCITFVLYYGKDWDGSKDLHGLLDFTNVPTELQSMVNNYKINLLDIKKLERTDMFHTDLKQVFDFIRYAEDKEKLRELVESDSTYTQMKEDAYDVIAAFTKSKELVKIKEMNAWKGEEQNMCQALREWAEEERMEGIELGRLEGRTEGMSIGRVEQQLDNLRAIMINLKLTAEKAMDILNVPQEERAMYMAKIS